MFFIFSSLPCFCPYYRSILTSNEVLQRLFPFFGVFLNELSNTSRLTSISHCRQMCLLLVISAMYLLIRYHTGDECIHCYRRDSLHYLRPNTISYCRQSCLSLAMNAFCAEDKHLTLETNAFRAGDVYFRVLETNALKTPVQTSATRIHNQLPATSKQKLC